jgi:hypothetical protein
VALEVVEELEFETNAYSFTAQLSFTSGLDLTGLASRRFHFSVSRTMINYHFLIIHN